MSLDFMEKTRSVLRTEQLVIEPIQKYIEAVHSHPGVIDCITWTGMAEEGLLLKDYGRQLPNGAIAEHCEFESTSEPHHWLEITFPGREKRVFIWNGSRQKLPGNSFVNKNSPGLWHGFTASDVRRQQVYPEIVQ